MKFFIFCFLLIGTASAYTDQRCWSDTPSWQPYFAHPTRCDLYYQCDATNGEATLLECAEGLYYDTQLFQCVWAVTDCTKGIEPQPEPEAPEVEMEPELLEECSATDDFFSPTHIPHPTDCTKFYICWKGYGYMRSCPSQLHWNIRNNWCDYPSIARCGERGVEIFPKPEEPLEPEVQPELITACPLNDDIAHPKHVPHPTDCTKFYKCFAGYGYIQKCPAGLHWSIRNNICDYPAEALCVPGERETPRPEEPQEPEVEPEQVTACLLYKDLGHPIQVPHPTDCTKFYKCDNGYGYMQDCPAGLHWNVRRNLCDYPSIARCGERAVEIVPKPEEPQEPEVEPELIASCLLYKDLGHPIQVPHPTDCTKFYICDTGYGYIQYCPAGLHWNVRRNWCDYPSIARCGERGVEIVPKPEEPQEPEVVPEVIASCLLYKDLGHPIQVPHPTDCTKFYICDTGYGYIQDCPAGLHWNVRRNLCDYPSISRCGERGGEIVPKPEEPQEPEVVPEVIASCLLYKDLGHPIQVPHPTDCTKFYICDTGYGYIQDCPAGLHWNVRRNLCDYPSIARCGERGGEIVPKPEEPKEPEVEPELIVSCLLYKDLGHPIQVPHPTDCTKFYICDTGYGYIQDCPAGLHWNVRRNLCDYPSIARCGERGVEIVPKPEERQKPVIPELIDSCLLYKDLTHLTHIPHPTDCTKFYKCENGYGYIQYCPAGLHWNVRRNLCDYPSIARCGERGVEIVPKPEERQKPVIPELIASCLLYKDLTHLTHIPHPTDCTKFYKCENGYGYIQDCPAGLHWNVRRNWCDYPSLALCGERGGEIVPKPEEPQEPEVEPELIASCLLYKDLGHPIQVPHPTDCTKFYICDTGYGYIQDCPAGLHWNVRRNLCDYPSMARCGERGVEIVPKPEEPQEPEVVPEVIASCLLYKDLGHPIQVPHPTDCTKFYICDTGYGYIQDCPAGLHWNVRRNLCDYPSSARCGERGGEIVPKPEEPQEPEVVPEVIASCLLYKDLGHPIQVPHPTDCTKFYICDTGYGYIQDCPAGLHWNVRRNLCDYPSIARCGERGVEIVPKPEEPQKPVIPELIASCLLYKDLTHPTQVPHPTDCTKFYRCENGYGYIQDCPAGLHWNVRRNLCDYPSLALCGERGGEIVPKPEEPEIEVEIKPERIAACPLYENPANPTILPHPTDCSKFYQCLAGYGYVQNCPAGLHWSIRSNVCDYPAEADCVPGQHREIPEPEQPVEPEIEPELITACPLHEDSENPTHLAHPTDCTKFYKCFNGYGYIHECPAGLHWNLRRNWCDYPSLALCGERGGEIIIKPEEPEVEEEPEKLAACPLYENPANPTILPHPTDCTKFYQCLAGYGYVQQCPAGLHWSVRNNVCDYPSQALCVPGEHHEIKPIPEEPSEVEPERIAACPFDENPDNPTHLPHPTDCTKFYKCLSGYGYIHDCPAGLHWNMRRNWCDYPSLSRCGERVTEIVPKPEEPQIEVKPEEPKISAACPLKEDSANPTQLPHPTDCTKFYKCLEGQAYIQDCPSGLHWSVRNNLCDWPSDAKCVAGERSGEIVPKPEEPKEPEVNIEPEVNRGCPANENPANPTQLAHPTDCTKFYKCLEGQAYIQDCPSGLHWSVRNNVCDWPYEAKCVVGERGGEVVPKPEEPKEPEVNIEPEVNRGCPANENPANPTQLAHPTDCTKFYKCLEGQAYIQDCPSGLHWSVRNNVCDWPSEAKCVAGERGGEVVPKPEEPKEPEVNIEPEVNRGCPANENPANPTQLAHPTDCTKFYKCLEGQAYIQDCPSGLHWSVRNNVCVWPSEAKCIPGERGGEVVPKPEEPKEPEVNIEPEVNRGCPANENPANPTQLAHPTDCTKFYKCLEGQAYIQDCPSGLHWSVRNNVCDWPSEAKCVAGERGGEVVPKPEEPKEPEVNIEPEVNRGCPANENPANPTQLAHPTDCTKFYKCLEGQAYIQDCPSGLHWSVRNNVCDWPSEAKCIAGERGGEVGPQPYERKQLYKNIKSKAISGCPAHENPANPTQLAHPTDCTKFYNCLEGQAYIQDCPSGLHWSVRNNLCDWPSEAKCIAGERGGEVVPKPEEPKEPEVKLECPANENPANPTQLAHPTDCTKFYKCLEGQAYIQDCPSGLHWSVRNNLCDWPSDAKCVAGERSGEVVPKPDEPKEPEVKLECPANENPANPTQLAHPADCTKFYKCLEGQAYIQDCPSGLHWSVRNNVCDWPSEAKCIPGERGGEVVPKPEEPKEPEVKLECPANENPANPTQLAHPTDCTKFYKCLEGQAYIQDCPAGLHWSVRSNLCDYPSNARCQ